MRILKKLFLIIPIAIFALMGIVAGYFILDRQDDYNVDLTGVEVPA